MLPLTDRGVNIQPAEAGAYLLDLWGLGLAKENSLLQLPLVERQPLASGVSMARGTPEGDADPLPVLDRRTVSVLHGLVEDGGLSDASL